MGTVTKIVTGPDGKPIRLPIPFIEAQCFVDGRLDRRKNYLLIDQTVFVVVTGTIACSGCSCDCGAEYGCNHEAHGCRECGYTGKRRETFSYPLESQHYKIPPPF